MGYPVRNFEQFKAGFEEAKSKSRLSAFLLFDESPSQVAVEAFAEHEFPMLDAIARRLDIFLFLFISKSGATGEVLNPSLEVAKRFGVGMRQLPGIVFFRDLREATVANSGVFIPLDVRTFDTAAAAEEVLKEIFDLVEQVLVQTSQESNLLVELERRVAVLKRKYATRPVMAYIGNAVKVVITYPGKLLEVMAEGFGKQAAKTALGG